MATASDIRDGGKTIVLTLTDATWVPSGDSFDGQRQSIIDGLDSAGSDPAGWNAIVRDTLSVTAVVRTSHTVVTITLPAFPDYRPPEEETVTVTVPSSAMNNGGDTIASPTFLIESAFDVAGASAFDELGELQARINARRLRTRKQLLQLSAMAVGVINDR